MSSAYGYASRAEGNCNLSLNDCGPTFGSTHRWCCPQRNSCSSDGYDRLCCDSADTFKKCLNAFVGKPTCAESTFLLYDNAGYFCCPGNEIAMRVIIGQNDIRSLCAPCTGFTVENATILLAVPQAIVSSSTATPSTSPTGSSPGNQTSAASSNSTSANTYDPSPQHESNRNTIMVCGLGLAFALSAQYQACVS